MHSRATLGLIAAVLCLPGCKSAGTPPSATTPPGATAPLFTGMGKHQREITTNSDLAQKYFDQGLNWVFAFNHDEAIRSFEQAARLDPQCAMAWWGIALANGPHINKPDMPAERSRAAWEALENAKTMAPGASPVEQDLIAALAKRYASPAPEDRKPLDQAYADAMRRVWKKHPDDADVGTLFAESMMDLRPWDLWTKDKQPQPGTDEIVAALDAVLALNADHPGGLHLHIHAVEASSQPYRAVAAADRLRNMVPASGHLNHMPSHIDVLTGRWGDAVAANDRAIAADVKYTEISRKQDFYRVYMAHNRHMLGFAAMMRGQSAVALKAMREMIDRVPDDYAKANVRLVDPMLCASLEVLKRFGRWDAILAEPAPGEPFRISAAMWHFHRGLAYAAKGNVAAAESEQTLFNESSVAVPQDAMMAINKAHDVLRIAGLMLDAEIAFRKKDVNQAVTLLNQAAELEDNLTYMEPPEWIQPVRHTLGAFLIADGRYAEAEKVYRDDLRKWPENGWALYGLAKALRSRGAMSEAEAIDRRFKRAWRKADVQIESSCLCVPGAQVANR
jgi:tetratricopeptide (TPR) repeat protein